MAAIFPPRIPTSAAYHGEPVPSMMRPLAITMSNGAAAPRRAGEHPVAPPMVATARTAVALNPAPWLCVGFVTNHLRQKRTMTNQDRDGRIRSYRSVT